MRYWLKSILRFRAPPGLFASLQPSPNPSQQSRRPKVVTCNFVAWHRWNDRPEIAERVVRHAGKQYDGKIVTLPPPDHVTRNYCGRVRVLNHSERSCCVTELNFVILRPRKKRWLASRSEILKNLWLLFFFFTIYIKTIWWTSVFIGI